MGRKQKPYQATSGEIIPSLAKDTNGRWRITSSGFRYSEPDERKAVDKFHAIAGRPYANCTAVEMQIGELLPDAPQDLNDITDQQADRLSHFFEAAGDGLADTESDDLPSHRLKFDIPDAVLWPWLRKQLTNRPAWFASQIGIPEIAGFRYLNAPGESIKLAEIRKHYVDTSTATGPSKQKALAPFDRMMKHTRAKTLADLTREKLYDFCQTMESDPTLTSRGTLEGYYSNIRGIIRLAKRSPAFDGRESSEAIERCSLLWTQKPQTDDDPRPISKADFHTLLAGVTQTDVPEMWRAMLLLGLNAALYMEDLCDLKWASLDLDKGTFLARRKKKGRRCSHG